MSVKALKKQFAAAIAMVVVSAVALSSSTYAWFVGQNTAKADGLTVKAQSEAGLLIRYGSSGDFASIAHGLHGDAVSLYPTSTAAGTKWFHANANKTNNHAAAEGSMKTLSLTETGGIAKDSDGKAYYIVDSFQMYSTGVAENLKVSDITVVTAGKTFDESLRLLLVCGETKLVTAPFKTSATVTYTVGTNPDDTTSAGTSVTAYGADATGGYASRVLATEVSSDKTAPTVVTVYAYYEGEDDSHTTDLFKDGANTLSVSLTFEADVTAGTP